MKYEGEGSSQSHIIMMPILPRGTLRPVERVSRRRHKVIVGSTIVVRCSPVSLFCFTSWLLLDNVLTCGHS